MKPFLQVVKADDTAETLAVKQGSYSKTPEFAARLARIKASLAKINAIMTDLKASK